MNLKHAHYVLTVLSEKSFTAAAKKLYVSQPSLSQTIKQVEANLGAPIFNRTADELQLTYAGERYVDAARKIMTIYNDLINEIEDLKGEVYGTLRLGVSMQRGMNLLPLILPKFIQRYPYVHIELHEHGSDVLERMVMDGEVDLALITTNSKVNQVEYVLIENETIVLMAANTTKIAREHMDGTPVSITDAADEAFISLKAGHSVRVIQDRLFEHYRISPKVILESDSFETAKHIAARAGAVMITPYVYIEHVSSLRPLVKCFPVKDLSYERHFYMCYRKGQYVTCYMQYLLELVREMVEEDRFGSPKDTRITIPQADPRSPRG